ncbi:unnamed protein product [Alopecurus aequalis]
MARLEELKLIGTWASPYTYVLRAQLALSFKGLSFENVEEDLSNKSELLRTSNPVHMAVPVLMHNGNPVYESLIIVRYVDEAFGAAGPPLLPADPYERAIARFWAAFIEDKCPYVLIHNGKSVCDSQVIVQYIDEVFSGTGPSLLPADSYERAVARFWAAYIDDKLLASWLQAARGKTDEEKTEGLKQTFVAVETMEAAFKTFSKGKPFFGGDSVGYLDVTLGALVAWVHAGEALYGMRLLDDAKSPLLAAWMARFGALDAVKVVLPDVDRLVELAKMKEAQAGAAATAGEETTN